MLPCLNSVDTNGNYKVMTGVLGRGGIPKNNSRG